MSCLHGVYAPVTFYDDSDSDNDSYSDDSDEIHGRSCLCTSLGKTSQRILCMNCGIQKYFLHMHVSDICRSCFGGTSTA